MKIQNTVRNMMLAGGLLCLVVFSAGCSQSVEPPAESEDIEVVEPQESEADASTDGSVLSPGEFVYAISGVDRDASPSADQDQQAELVGGNNAFAFDLYQAVRDNGQNCIYSPYSISLALAMAYAGAGGSTEQQMAETLHYTLPQDQLHPAFNALDLYFESLDESDRVPEDEEVQPFRLNIANAIWGQHGFPFTDAYLETLARNYGAGLRLVDFVNEPEPARLAINRWVEDETEERIKDLLKPGIITPDTRLVLTNAIYFYGAWMMQFEESATQEEPFKLIDGSQVTASLMNKSEQFLYTEGEGFQALQMGYQSGNALMIVILPEEGSFETVAASLDSARFEEIAGGMQSRQVDVFMPRFEYEAEFNLADTLAAMGMPDAFDPSAADFSAIAGPDQPLYISEVIHKAFVKVDEQGTEAAAATAVVMKLGMAVPDQTITFRADHPFIFVIVDNATGSILFVGQVVDPS
ncbi:MAG: serpin family protein [Anaerolineae bacterium]|nr:serpin family protein [Anaerolineae bacterium]